MPDRVYVFDSSAAINLRDLSHGVVRSVVDRLVEMASEGLIAFPEQVYREVCEDRWSDHATAFIHDAREVRQHPEEVDPEVLYLVLEDETGSLLTPQDSMQPHHADAYVVALALDAQGFLGCRRRPVVALPLQPDLQPECPREPRNQEPRVP